MIRFVKNWIFPLSITLIMIIIAVFVGYMTKSSWEAIGAIGTFLMAIATFVALWCYQKEKQERENRVIIERIIYPLIESLKSIINGKIDNWSWREIKTHPFYLSLKIEQKIINKLDEFDKTFEELKKEPKKLKKEAEELKKELEGYVERIK